MPTPVSAARQCFAGEAAAALDEAVAIARRRGHAQTTSLHVVSALLSLPSSSSSLLRDALSRARSAAYSPRLQFKALELCFSVALDRLPSAGPGAGGGDGGQQQQQQPAAEVEPPVSNSLMAAIKRSQANQRRNPDTFHLYQHYQQQQQQQNSVAGVKVELQQLVLSILDDPVVSRVFGEAGFRSYDIKFAVLHPPPSILRFPRAARCPPLFLCNFSIGADEFELSPRGFGFPFSSQPLCGSDGTDENCRRIAEVLVRKQGRNPLLVGVGAVDAALDFERAVGRQNWAAFPPEVRGVKFFSIEKEVSEFARGGRERSWLDSRFGEIALWLAAEERGSSPGIVLSVGDLKGLVDLLGEGKDSDGAERASYIVSEFTKVVHGHPGKLWLIGSAATYETYMKFLSQYPSVDKDWDLQLLPITTLKPRSGALLPRTNSLMEPFVSFEGLFPIASNPMAPVSRQDQPVPCHLCNDKYDQEIAALLKEFSAPIGDKYQVNLPNQLRQNELTSISSGLDAEKAKDDGTILNVKVMDLRKKWNDICQHKHQGSQIVVSDTFGIRSEVFPRVISLPYVADKLVCSNQTNENIDEPQVQSTGTDAFPVAASAQKIPATSRSISFPLLSDLKKENPFPKQMVRPSSTDQLQRNDFLSHSGCLSDVGAPDDLTSLLSASSVSTDLMLGTVNASPRKNKSARLHTHGEPLHDLPGCLTLKADAINGNVSAASVQYSSCFASDSPVLGTYLPVQSAPGLRIVATGIPVRGQQDLHSSNECQAFDIKDFKAFCRSLAEKVGWQEEAIRSIGETLYRFRNGVERLHGASLRGDIWLSFLGPDKIGKRKIAMALAELLFGSREKLICVDLSTQDGHAHSNTVCRSNWINVYDSNIRGKTVLDCIAEEIRKKPWSVVLLEGVDKADLLVQSSLSQAIKTGKFSDSHGREIGINNLLFVMSAGEAKGKLVSSSRANVKFSEERILAAQARQMKFLVGTAPDSLGSILSVSSSGASTKESRNANVFISKRKLSMPHDGTRHCESMGIAKRANKSSNTFLDLNLPVEEMIANDADSSSGGSNSLSESLDLWMEEFLDAVDENVVFKPFDFDALAEEILKEIDKNIQAAVGSKCVLEIDPKVMEHILAATWLSESKGSLNNWIQQVLIRSFVEARQIHHLSALSVLRLVSCEDAALEDRAPGILLPSRILLN
ncbi:hypothetical protein Taro_021321 [Colocasia esculenta]|uniref:Clp R domain-containing protein n=1 Tax=Colocasia esculenta TaxID=4460 RepID=A0A843V4M9_COLES|nr:hypothetical protein [Colocasia esculenta]